MMRELFKHALKRSFDQRLVLVAFFLMPLAAAFIPAHEGTLPFGMYIYGMIILFSSFTLAKSVMEDKNKGILTRILSAPVRYAAYLGAHLLVYLMLLMMQNLVFLLMVHVRWNGVDASLLPIMLLYFGFDIMSLSLCLAWNSLFKSYNLSFGLFSGFASVLCLITGVTIPLFLFPDTLKRYVSVLPTYWLSSGLDYIYQSDWQMTGIAFVILFVYGILFLLIGSWRKYV